MRSSLLPSYTMLAILASATFAGAAPAFSNLRGAADAKASSAEAAVLTATASSDQQLIRRLGDDKNCPRSNPRWPNCGRNGGSDGNEDNDEDKPKEEDQDKPKPKPKKKDKDNQLLKDSSDDKAEEDLYAAPIGSNVDKYLVEKEKRKREAKLLRYKREQKLRAKQANQKPGPNLQPNQGNNSLLARYRRWKRKRNNKAHDARKRDRWGRLKNKNARAREQAKKKESNAKKLLRKKKQEDAAAKHDHFNYDMASYVNADRNAIGNMNDISRNKRLNLGANDRQAKKDLKKNREDQNLIANEWNDYAKKLQKRDYALDVFIHNIGENFKIKKETERVVGKLNIADDVKNKLNAHLKQKVKLLRQRDEWTEWEEEQAAQKKEKEFKRTDQGPDAAPVGEEDVEVVVNGNRRDSASADDGAAAAANDLGEGEQQQPARNDGKLVDDISNADLGRNDLDQQYNPDKGMNDLQDMMKAEEDILGDIVNEMNDSQDGAQSP